MELIDIGLCGVLLAVMATFLLDDINQHVSKKYPRVCLVITCIVVISIVAALILAVVYASGGK